ASVTQTIQQPASVALIPMPRFNAILVAAPKGQLKYVIAEIERLDKPNSPASQMRPFPLKSVPASRVAALITSWYHQRYGPEGRNQHQIRIIAEDKTNSVLVQAAPADMTEIEMLIRHIDQSMPGPVNEIRIVTLHSAISDDLTAILTKAITDGIMTPSLTP